MRLHSQKRHLLKAVTWRVIGTLDTMLLSWIISGSPSFGLKIGAAEVFTKMLLYYLHERVWFNSKVAEANKRHIFKTITWRILGTLDTLSIAWVVTGNPMTGLKIGAAELTTKMLLYYAHERVWYRINFGLDNRENK